MQLMGQLHSRSFTPSNTFSRKDNENEVALLFFYNRVKNGVHIILYSQNTMFPVLSDIKSNAIGSA
jgi:hypothetical protein